MTADQLLIDLGQATGLPGLRLDAAGCARLVFDGHVAVNLEHDPDARAMHLYTTVGTLPAQGREALYVELLQANLFGAGTHGATLAVDPAHHEVVLCRTVGLDDASGPGVLAVVEGFVAAAEEWITRLDARRAPAPAAEGAPSPRELASFLRA
ncbi:MAG TPA: type III secretion system chaperone [Ramlibacter sp.]|jgi:hypothetical protein|uniref:type III secretion system chaperone n=1 Tax=Ramlibacter sp. TaxID=1917967 RepID=UPI002D44D5AF|nr:type III secretion system chaperone [Ramlibacter sp.]HZY20493.1 type III secretion system chaperone [Ramlibacter sp.]